MTALAPLPPPEPSTEVDLGTELDGLRRRADEQAGLLRKHQTTVTQLADSVAALVALGRKRSRWINLNSFVAYVLFTVLLGGAMLLVYRARVGEVAARRGQAVAEHELAHRATTPAVPVDDGAALALYQLVRAGDDAALIAREAEIAKAALTPAERAVMTDAVAAARARQAHRGDDGISAWKAGAWADAVTALDRTLADDPTGPRAAQVRYYLGVAKWKLGDFKAAADQLGQALAGQLDPSAADARYFFAASLDKLGDTDRARAEYDRFATAHPKHQLAVFARRRSAILERRGRPAPAKPAGEDGAAPAPAPADEPVAPAAAQVPVPAPAAHATSAPPP